MDFALNLPFSEIKKAFDAFFFAPLTEKLIPSRSARSPMANGQLVTLFEQISPRVHKKSETNVMDVATTLASLLLQLFRL